MNEKILKCAILKNSSFFFFYIWVFVCAFSPHTRIVKPVTVYGENSSRRIWVFPSTHWSHSRPFFSSTVTKIVFICKKKKKERKKKLAHILCTILHIVSFHLIFLKNFSTFTQISTFTDRQRSLGSMGSQRQTWLKWLSTHAQSNK